MLRIIVFLLSGFCSLSWADTTAHFDIQAYIIEQPVDHDNPTGSVFNQHYYVLTPTGLTSSSKIDVMYILGNENDATKQRLVKIYEAYGSPSNLVFVLAEHRGYGESVYGDSQQKPIYISMDAAAADSHRIIEQIRSQYAGKLIINGCSYGGSLVIRYAHLYPESYDVVISSSAVLRYPFINSTYADKLNETLDPEVLARLAEHIQTLYMKRNDPEYVRQMELIHTLIMGIAQVGPMDYLNSVAKYISYLPTSALVYILDVLLPPAAHNWANGQSSFVVPSTPQTRNWYTWKYQQCYQTGTFMVGYPFSMTKSDYMQRCQQSFGELPPYADEPMLDLTDDLRSITKPVIIIAGEQDPWINLGVKPEHDFTNIQYLYGEQWHHCPDKDTPDASEAVRQALSVYLN